MRKQLPDKIERGRMVTGDYASSRGETHGVFSVRGPKQDLLLIVSSGEFNEVSREWEHVSVSLSHRTPTWREMCWVKDAFWEDEDQVIQYHPPKSDYVNHHPYCLHLWRHVSALPAPPAQFVGPKTGSIS